MPKIQAVIDKSTKNDILNIVVSLNVILNTEGIHEYLAQHKPETNKF